MELFGTPQGQSLAEQDMARQAMTTAQVQHMGMQDLAVPGQMQQRQAQTRWLNARAGEKEADIDVQRRVAEMAGDTAWSAEDKANPGWKFAELYQRAGASPDKVIKMANQAAQIDVRQAAVDTQVERQALMNARATTIRANNLASSMAGVNSPEALRDTLIKYEQNTGDHTGLIDQQGNLAPQAAEDWEGTKGKIEQMAITARDRSLADYRERSLQSADRERTSKQKNRDFWQNTENQEERAAAQAHGRGRKAGVDIFDKAEGARLGTDFVGSQFLNVDTSQSKVLGRKLAERAGQMRNLNPALTPTEATQLAFDKMQDEGLFTGLKMRPPGALESEKRPLTLPDNKEQLKEGFWYSDGKEKRQWLGKDKGWKSNLPARADKGKGQNSAGPIRGYAPVTPDTSDEEDNETDNMAMEGEEGE